MDIPCGYYGEYITGHDNPFLNMNKKSVDSDRVSTWSHIQNYAATNGAASLPNH